VTIVGLNFFGNDRLATLVSTQWVTLRTTG